MNKNNQEQIEAASQQYLMNSRRLERRKEESKKQQRDFQEVEDQGFDDSWRISYQLADLIQITGPNCPRSLLQVHDHLDDDRQQFDRYLLREHEDFEYQNHKLSQEEKACEQQHRDELSRINKQGNE